MKRECLCYFSSYQYRTLKKLILATGLSLNHIFYYFVEWKERLKGYREISRTVSDLEKLIRATMKMPNELHIISPSLTSYFAARFCSIDSKTIYQMTEGS